MARNNKISTAEMGINYYVNASEPWDALTIFETLDEVDNIEKGIPVKNRYKGQKFVVKTVYEKDENNEYVLDEDGERINIGPKEYWFIDDYIEAGTPRMIFIVEGELYGKDVDEIFGEYFEEYDKLYGGDHWDDNDWEWKSDPEEFIPEPVLYTPDIPDCNLDDIWRAIKTHKHIFKVRKPVTALEVGGVKKGDRLFNLRYV